MYATLCGVYLLLSDVFPRNNIVVSCVFSPMWKVKFVNEDSGNFSALDI